MSFIFTEPSIFSSFLNLLILMISLMSFCWTYILFSLSLILESGLSMLDFIISLRRSSSSSRLNGSLFLNEDFLSYSIEPKWFYLSAELIKIETFWMFTEEFADLESGSVVYNEFIPWGRLTPLKVAFIYLFTLSYIYLMN